MALLDWSTDYSVKVDSIDQQHQKLFVMLNELHDAMKAGKGAQLAPQILKSLVQYTREHFAWEEGLMARAGYPELASHQAEHNKLTSEVAKMVQDIENGNAVLSMELLEFLRNWLQQHILGRDQKYAPYL